jgi:hypothetical protein
MGVPPRGLRRFGGNKALPVCTTGWAFEAHRMTTPTANKHGAGWRARSEAIARLVARTKRLDEAQVTRSDEELIAEAITAGKVRRIPTGTSGLPEFEPTDNS